VLILSSHLYLVLPNRLFLGGFTALISPLPRPYHLLSNSIQQHTSCMNCVTYAHFPSPCCFRYTGSKYFFRKFVLEHSDLNSSTMMTEKVSRPHNTAGKNVVLFAFSYENRLISSEECECKAAGIDVTNHHSDWRSEAGPKWWPSGSLSPTANELRQPRLDADVTTKEINSDHPSTEETNTLPPQFTVINTSWSSSPQQYAYCDIRAVPITIQEWLHKYSRSNEYRQQ
jgi:hypothetical protein